MRESCHPFYRGDIYLQETILWGFHLCQEIFGRDWQKLDPIQLQAPLGHKKKCLVSGNMELCSWVGRLVLNIKGRLPVLLCAVKTAEGDFRFCWTITPNVGQTHKENPNLARILYMVCTLNDIYKQYNKLHEH